MAKKDEPGDLKIFNSALETIANALANPETRNEILAALKTLLDEFSNDEKSNAAVENLRTALANLGLKIIDDINSKRVHKPEEIYNALVSIYNAIK